MSVKKFSELKIIFSNCLIHGSSNGLDKTVLQKIRLILNEVSGLEFRAINVNDVSGDHSAFTIIVIGTFYNLTQEITNNEMLDLEYLLIQLVSKINGFSCSEVRIEHTRHRTSFRGLSHPQLARVI